jgi:hypothetical protein
LAAIVSYARGCTPHIGAGSGTARDLLDVLEQIAVQGYGSAMRARARPA